MPPPTPLRLPRRLRAVALAAAALAVVTFAPAGAQEEWRPSADVGVSYRIEATLRPAADGDQLVIRGREWIEWRNTTGHAATSVYFHLYPNAFRGNRTTMMRQFSREGRDLPETWGETVVSSIELTDGRPLALEFVSPDDGNPDDRTVARVVLPEPVEPGGSLSLWLRFRTHLPSLVRRMGQHEDFVMAAQWYPKLGRFLGATDRPWKLSEGWYCNQYHRSSEFFADYADYDVTLTTPEDAVVGATGELLEETPRPGGTTRRRFRARSVVDFAWTSYPGYLKETRTLHPARRLPEGDDDRIGRERDRLVRITGLPDSDFELPPVQVTVLLQPEHADQMERHFEAARVALSLYGMWLGPYPYGQLTIVDPTRGGRHAGGMEYPQLVTAGTVYGSPAASQRPEGVIVHEIGHQWLMNLLANNEPEESWLDEGINTFLTRRALRIGYGRPMGTRRVLGFHLLSTPLYRYPGVSQLWSKGLGLPEWARPPKMEIFDAWRDLPPLTGLPTARYHADPYQIRRTSYMRRVGWDEMVQPAWEYRDRSSYGANVYSRPTLLLVTLRRTLAAQLGRDEGHRAFDLALREYARAFRFRHPTTPDFFATFGGVTGLDMAPIVAELVESTGVLDYAVEDFRIVKEPRPEGIDFPRDEDAEPADDGPPHSRRTEVTVRRRGELAVPVRIRVEWDPEAPPPKGTPALIEWDGRERWKRFVFDGKAVSVHVDPERIYLQDVDLGNNSRTRDPNHRPAAKWSVRFLLWLENALVSYGRFF